MRSGFVSPIHSYTFRLIATAVTFGVIGVAAALSAPSTIDMPSLPLTGSREIVTTSTAIAPPPGAVHLVFRAEGATYLKLRDADPMPAHGTPVLHEADEASAWQTISIADTDDVPGWRGRTVTIGHLPGKGHWLRRRRAVDRLARLRGRLSGVDRGQRARGRCARRRREARRLRDRRDRDDRGSACHAP